MRPACLVAALLVVALLGSVPTAPAAAAGGGAGAGGAGSQRAINSGLPPGEAGPAGAPNNRGGPVPAPSPVHGLPRPEAGDGRAGQPPR